MLKVFKQARAAVAMLNAVEVRKRALRPVHVGLVAKTGAQYAEMEDLLLPAEMSREQRLERIGLIHRAGDQHFRWHDSGDLQDLEHLRKIVRVCLNLPRVKFWLPTREYQTVEAYRRMGNAIPANLCIRYSAHLVDGFPPIRYGLPTSGVHSGESAILAAAHVCPAPKQNMKCGNCRACWDPSVKIVSYHLKYGTSDGYREVSDGAR